jgi:hypothetical protein
MTNEVPDMNDFADRIDRSGPIAGGGMNAEERARHRRDWEGRLSRQKPHPVYQPVEVLWDEPWDETGCVLRERERLAIDESFLTELRFHERVKDHRVTWEQVKQWEALRRTWIERMERDPFQFGWISEYFRPLLVELCRKRLAHPGEVIEFLVTGGNRPGKTKTLIHLVDCNFIYSPRPPGFEEDDTWKGQVMVLHESESMSRKWHHPEIFAHLPKDLKQQARKKSTTDTAFNYNAKGFTNDWFQVLVKVKDEDGREFVGGGRFEMRNYGQDEDTFQGGEYNTILSDELIPPPLVKTLNARLASRVEMTREPWFQARIRKLLKMLEEGVPFHLIHRALLGAVMQGVHVIAFTPIRFYTATVKMFLAGAKKYGWREAPVLKTMAGVPRTQVPGFAQPPDPLRLVAYIPTSANIWKPAYHAIMGGAMSGGHRQVRMKLYGDVEQDQRTEFANAWNPEVHLCDWKDIPRKGSVYVVIDGGGAKPWFIGLWVVDPLQRLWQAMEWPCESLPINGALPGPWALVSTGDKLNGDEGPAQELRLGWSLERQGLNIWEMLRTFCIRLEKSGEPWQGSMVVKSLKLTERGKVIELNGECAKPWEVWGDPRWAHWNDASTGNKIDEEFANLKCGFGELRLPAGTSKSNGNMNIHAALGEWILDQPRVRVNRECTNTIFMFTHYTLAPHSESTRAQDEACGDPNAVWRYFMLSSPRYIDIEAIKQRAEENEG